MRTYNVAVAGALGLVGTTMVRILEEFAFPVGELRLLERRDLAGAPVKFRDRLILTTEASAESFEGIERGDLDRWRLSHETESLAQ